MTQDFLRVAIVISYIQKLSGVNLEKFRKKIAILLLPAPRHSVFKPKYLKFGIPILADYYAYL